MDPHPHPTAKQMDPQPPALFQSGLCAGLTVAGLLCQSGSVGICRGTLGVSKPHCAMQIAPLRTHYCNCSSTYSAHTAVQWGIVLSQILTKIQYSRKETNEDSKSSSQKPSQKNEQQKEKKVHFFSTKVDQSGVR